MAIQCSQKYVLNANNKGHPVDIVRQLTTRKPECPGKNVNPAYTAHRIAWRRTSQWRNYERRSEAIASGRQAAGGARGALLVDGLFALHYRIQRNF